MLLAVVENTTTLQMIDAVVQSRLVLQSTEMLNALVLKPLVLQPLMLESLVLNSTKMLNAPHVLRSAEVLGSHVPATEARMATETARVAATDVRSTRMPAEMATSHMPAAHVATATHVPASTTAVAMAGLSMGSGGQRNDETGRECNTSGADHGQDSKLNWPSEYLHNYSIHLIGQQASKIIRRLSIF